MTSRISRIENDVQDQNSEAWQKLCEYIELVEREDREEFSPYEVLGKELYFQIFTLPESISKLKSVKKIWLYGSKLKRVPPEIGQMDSLEYFDPYTSYDLHWFPYEIYQCKALKDSRVSTRALYGNFKNRMSFPRLDHNPVRYNDDTVTCSICKKEIKYENTNQKWITLRVGTDDLPLLVNLCSELCEEKLPQPPKGYVPIAHKGGADLQQPSYEEWRDAHMTRLTASDLERMTKEQAREKRTGPLKLIRKIWGKK